MNIKILKSAIAGLILSVSGFANASLIHTFIFDDLSMWSQVDDFENGDSLSITFKDSTNFNSVLSTDILGFKYNLARGSTQSYDISDFTFIGNGGNFSQVFSMVGDDVFMTYFNYSFVGYIQANKNGLFAQVVPGQTTHAYTRFTRDNGFVDQASFSNLNISSVSYKSSSTSVPEPSTLATFALAIMGLASSRFKKQ